MILKCKYNKHILNILIAYFIISSHNISLLCYRVDDWLYSCQNKGRIIDFWLAHRFYKNN